MTPKNNQTDELDPHRNADELDIVLVELHRAGSRRTEQYIRVAKNKARDNRFPASSYNVIQRDCEKAKKEIQKLMSDHAKKAYEQGYDDKALEADHEEEAAVKKAELEADLKARIEMLKILKQPKDPILEETLLKLQAQTKQEREGMKKFSESDKLEELGHKATMRQYDPVSYQAGYNKRYKRGLAKAKQDAKSMGQARGVPKTIKKEKKENNA